MDLTPGFLSPNMHPLDAWEHQTSHGKSSEFPVRKGTAPCVDQVNQGFFLRFSTALPCELKKTIGFTRNNSELM